MRDTQAQVVVARALLLRLVVLGSTVAGVALGAGCQPSIAKADAEAHRVRQHLVSLDPLLDELEQRTFRFFWETASSENGLVPDRWPTPSFSSVAAVGFGLTAIPIGVERGWITREQGRDRVLVTLRFLWRAPSGPQAAGVTSYRGFFYHFLDMEGGARYRDVELSTVDTALLLGGVLFCREYFDRENALEAELRSLAGALFERVEWDWPRPRSPLISMGWTPEGGFHNLDWHGLNEAAIVYLLALGSPTHPVEPEAWEQWTRTYRWGDFYGQQHVGFGPLFGHQFTHVWVDFRGIQDGYMRARGIDYFENSRRAALAQRAYAIANPGGFAGYGPDCWGLSACDGPADVTVKVGGREVRFFTYGARAASFTELRDDGTITPMAAAASIPFAPEVAVPAIQAMRERWSGLWSRYGFLDAVNPTFGGVGVAPAMGMVSNGVWVDTDYLGIDQGPIVAMLENYRSGLVWRFMRRSPYLVTGLRRAGFGGAWLDAAGGQDEAAGVGSRVRRREASR